MRDRGVRVDRRARCPPPRHEQVPSLGRRARRAARQGVHGEVGASAPGQVRLCPRLRRPEAGAGHVGRTRFGAKGSRPAGARRRSSHAATDRSLAPKHGRRRRAGARPREHDGIPREASSTSRHGNGGWVGAAPPAKRPLHVVCRRRCRRSASRPSDEVLMYARERP